MRKHAVLLAFAALLGTTCAWGAQQHPARGIVIEVGKAHRSLVVSCDAIPGYMDPMEMSFVVRDSTMLTAIKPGTTIRFTIVEGDHVLYADNIQAITAANLESEPMEAGGLVTKAGFDATAKEGDRLEGNERARPPQPVTEAVKQWLRDNLAPEHRRWLK